jgi:hypothetical protein
MPTRPERGGCCRITTITSRLRFTADNELTAEEVGFGRAMNRWLVQHHRIDATCAEVLDIAIDMGYVGQDRNFEASVHAFTRAMHTFKRTTRRPRPLWSECLQVMKKLGWKLPAKITAPEPSASAIHHVE